MRNKETINDVQIVQNTIVDLLKDDVFTRSLVAWNDVDFNINSECNFRFRRGYQKPYSKWMDMEKVHKSSMPPFFTKSVMFYEVLKMSDFIFNRWTKFGLSIEMRSDKFINSLWKEETELHRIRGI